MTATEATLRMLEVSTHISTPLLLGALSAGLLVGLLQAVFQLQEATLGLVARILGIWLVIAQLGGAMLELFVQTSIEFLLSVGQ